MGADTRNTSIGLATDPGTARLTLNLPNGFGAYNYSTTMVGMSTGPYNASTNSCVTYCGDVLRAGGLAVPRTTRDLVRYFRD